MCNCNWKHSAESKVKRRSGESKDRETKREGGSETMALCRHFEVCLPNARWRQRRRTTIEIKAIIRKQDHDKGMKDLVWLLNDTSLASSTCICNTKHRPSNLFTVAFFLLLFVPPQTITNTIKSIANYGSENKIAAAAAPPTATTTTTKPSIVHMRIWSECVVHIQIKTDSIGSTQVIIDNKEWSMYIPIHVLHVSQSIESTQLSHTHCIGRSCTYTQIGLCVSWLCVYVSGWMSSVLCAGCGDLDTYELVWCHHR